MTYSYDRRAAAVNRLEPLVSQASKDVHQAMHNLQVALNTMSLVEREARMALPKNYQRRAGRPDPFDPYHAVSVMAEGVVEVFEKAKIISETKRLVEIMDETLSETRLHMADLKTASTPQRIARRYANSSMANRIKDVQQWMGEALNRTHQSGTYLKGILAEASILASGGDHNAKAHADHMKKALDATMRVEKEVKAVVDHLDHLAREFR